MAVLMIFDNEPGGAGGICVELHRDQKGASDHLANPLIFLERETGFKAETGFFAAQEKLSKR